MEKPERLSKSDEKDYFEIVHSLLFIFNEKQDSTGESSTETNDSNYRIMKKNRKDRDKGGLTPDAPEAVKAEDFLGHIKENYDFQLNNPIDPVQDWYVPAILPTDEEDFGTSAVPFAYSKVLYLLGYYLDADETRLKKNLKFFKVQLSRAAKGLAKEPDSPNWRKWFDWLWLLSKNTSWFIGELPEYISLHNRYWTSRVNPIIQKGQNPSDLFLYSKELPDDFNNEIETFIHSSFGHKNVVYGNNPLLYKCFLDALNFANDNEPCLILGETGTGKESIAKLIHAASDRRNNKFVPLNCAGFTDTLFSSEVSGVIKGASTEVATRLGAFLTASGYKLEKQKQGRGYISKISEPPKLHYSAGTIFLDEINSFELTHQAKVLRIIQEKEVQVVGEDTVRPIKVKVVCAANEDILKQCLAKTFRDDLYYRISRGIIRVPSLREMPDAIPDIAIGKIKELNAKRLASRRVAFSDKALEKLKNYAWPGNIRELENVVYRAFKQAVIEGGVKIRPHHIQLQEDFTKNEELPCKTQKSTESKSRSPYDDLLYKDAVSEFQKAYLAGVLEKTKGNKSATKRLTGMSRATIDQKIRDYEIDLQSFKCP